MQKSKDDMFQRYGHDQNGRHCTFDGTLSRRQPWPTDQVIWLVPPRDRLREYCEKAVQTARLGGIVIAILESQVLGDRWFHELCPLGRVTFLRHRIASHPYGSLRVEWSPTTLSNVAEGRLDFVFEDGRPMDARFAE